MNPLGFITGASTFFGGSQNDVTNQVFSSDGDIRNSSIDKGATEVDVVTVADVGVSGTAIGVKALVKADADVFFTGGEERGETDARLVGYGAMLMEGMVAIVSLCCLMMLATSSLTRTWSPSYSKSKVVAVLSRPSACRRGSMISS